ALYCILTLSLHDALPISIRLDPAWGAQPVQAEHATGREPRRTRLQSSLDSQGPQARERELVGIFRMQRFAFREPVAATREMDLRSEEHTSELQSRENLVC